MVWSFAHEGIFVVLQAKFLPDYLNQLGNCIFEYCFQVPANKIGFQENGGPFSLIQLKVIQEVITLTVFILFTILFFPNEHFKPNHVISFIFLICAVYFAFKQ